MMKVPNINEIEALATSVGLSRAALCREAQIAPSTLTRWKSQQTLPSTRVLGRVMDAIERVRIKNSLSRKEEVA